MKRKMLTILLLLALVCAGCVPSKTSPAGSSQPVQIRLPLGYIPNVQFAPLYIAIEKGYFSQAGLEVTLDYNMETDSVALVGAGQLSFAVVSGEQVLLGRAQGLPVVYFMAWYQKYPVGVTALKELGLRRPSDLKGRKIGLPGLYGANYIGLVALLDSAGLGLEDVSLDSIGYTQVEALTAKRDEAVVIYTANEPLQLAANGYETDTLRVSDYSPLVANGLITNEKTIKENPDLVKRLAAATLKGISDAIANPDEAFEISKKYVENLAKADEKIQKVQRQVLAASIELWQADRPGYSDPEVWQNMQRILIKMGLLKTPLELDSAFSNNFLPK